MLKSTDANIMIGNSSFTYVGEFWAGFILPGGLAACLMTIGLFFAKPLNRMNMLTLPDFYSRRYNGFTEVLVSLMMAFSFTILVAGNFAGGAWIINIVFGIDYITALILVAVLVSA